MAVLAGPLCEEPMWGVAIVVESWTCKGYDDPGLSGSLITAMKNSCRFYFSEILVFFSFHVFI